MRIWIDVEDLYQYFGGSNRPSGIQRLAYELQRALRDKLGGDTVRFLRHNRRRDGFVTVPWFEIEAMFEQLTAPAASAVSTIALSPKQRRRPARAWLKWLQYRLPDHVRISFVNAFRAQLTAVRAQRKALQAELAAVRALCVAMRPRRVSLTAEAVSEASVRFETLLAPGDVFAILGSPWLLPRHPELVRQMRDRHGLRILVLVYDLIPIRRPEWCNAHLVKMFQLWMTTTLPIVDHLLAISESTAADVERYAREQGLQIVAPVRVIPVGSGFHSLSKYESDAVRDDLPMPGSYVLCVSTIEARKNHQVLIRVWRRLLEELPPGTVPTLVFAGRIGWLVQDLMEELQNAEYMGGKIRIVESPSDTELLRLYCGCLFTVFASYYEGWGLPVTESLSLGKPCVISNTTSLPEAGGALARYFDPENANDATRVIRATIEDRDGLAAWEAEVVATFRPVRWEDSAAALLDALS